MDHAIQPAPAPPKSTKRKPDPAYLAHQYAQGKTSRELGRQYNVSHVTILDWLSKVEQEKQGVERFKQNRADILARIQGKTLVLQEQIVDELVRDRLANALTPQQKAGLLQSLNIVHGTLFDKERLERGQSTANISTISRMVDTQVKTLYTRSTPQHIDNHPSIIRGSSEVVDNQENKS